MEGGGIGISGGAQKKDHHCTRHVTVHLRRYRGRAPQRGLSFVRCLRRRWQQQQ